MDAEYQSVALRSAGGELLPTECRRPTTASNPDPVRWEGWVDPGPSLGRRWVVVVVTGAA